MIIHSRETNHQKKPYILHLQHKKYLAKKRKTLLKALQQAEEASFERQKLLLLEKCTTKADIFFLQSIFHLKKHQHSSAVYTLKQCLVEEKQDTTACFLLASCLLKLKRPFECISILVDFLNTQHGHHKLWNQLGAAYRHVGKDSQAEAAFETALSLSCNFKPAIKNLTQLYIDQRKFQLAIDWQIKLVFVSGQTPQEKQKLGKCYLLNGELNKALFWYRAAQKLQ